jgi:hypothetical protein
MSEDVDRPFFLASVCDQLGRTEVAIHRTGAWIMRHGWTVVPALVILGFGLFDLTGLAHGAEPLDDRLGIRTAPIFLLTRSDIQSELKIDPKLAAACGHVAAGLRLRASSLKGVKVPTIVAARRAIDEEMSQWLVKNLSPAQLDRLDQIELQWEGPSAMLTRPFLDESLNLTREQREKLTSCLAEGKAHRAQGKWTFEDHRELTRKSLTILSENQRHLWVRILGEPCLFNIGVNEGTPAARVTTVPPPQPR